MFRTSLVMALGFAFSSAAMATEYNIYSGMFCASNTPSSPLAYSGGHSDNTTSSSLTVDCPAERSLSSSAKIVMYLNDQSTSSNVSCYASSIIIGTGSGWWSSTGSSSGYGSATQTVSLGTVSGTSGTDLHVTCSVPAYSSSTGASGIQTYSIYEY